MSVVDKGLTKTILKLNVKLRFPDGQKIFCGEVFTASPTPEGKIEGSFRYSKEYLDHPGAFSLDPENLPLIPHEINTDRAAGVHGVFEDALPDDWGRKLLAKKANLSRVEQTVPNLLKALGSNGLGALAFESGKTSAYKESSASIHALSEIVEAALKYDAGLPIDEESLRSLFTCGSSPGGARPKALIQKETGSLWIAKIPKADDKFYVEPIEAGTLQMARNAGLSVPEFEIQEAGDRKVLLIKRFDVSEQGGRYHMISMQTFLNAEGYYFLSYSHMFNVIQKYSSQTSQDVDAMFRQMVFNIAVGNTDDHLKNFCMLHKNSGFCLSPVYDVLPDIHQNREHRLSFPQGSGSLPIGWELLQRIGKVYHVSNPGQIIDDVFHAVEDWRDIFREYEVPESDIQKLNHEIQRRITLIENSGFFDFQKN